MSEHQTEDDPDTESDQEVGGRDSISLIPGINRHAESFLELVGGTGLYIWGDDLQAMGFPGWGLFFHYLALDLILLLLAGFVFQKLQKRKSILTVWIVACIVLGIFYWDRSAPNPEPLPKPKVADLQLYLQIGDDDDTRTLLTNSLSVVTSNSDFGFSRLNSCLVVPIHSNQSSVELELEVVNLSSNSDEQAEIWAGIPEDWTWSTTNGWTAAREKIVLTQRVFGVLTTNKMKFLGFDVPRPLHSRTGQITDAFRIEIKPARWLFMVLREQYKEALGAQTCVEINFQEVPNPVGLKPVFRRTKINPDGTRSLDEQLW